MQEIIQLDSIYKIYEMGEIAFTALNNVSLSIKKGEFVAIMGASGSGKSTLMNILGCLDLPTKGRYCFEGVDVSRFSKNELAEIRNKKLGFVFQNFNLLGRTTVLENIELPLIYAKKITKSTEHKIYETIRILGLEGLHKNYPSQLSGGQQQRVAIARAIINNPSLLLADEPTGNLDSATSKEVMNVLCELNREMDLTIVLVTHEEDIARHTRRIIMLKDGKVLSDAETHSSSSVSSMSSM